MERLHTVYKLETRFNLHIIKENMKYEGCFYGKFASTTCL